MIITSNYKYNVSSAQYMDNMFDNTLLSEEYKCTIDSSFSVNDAWPYEWSESCNLNNRISIIAPQTFSLHKNSPNPFNPITTLKFDIPEDSFVDITVYDMLGNVISNLVHGDQNSGYKSVQWDATNSRGQPVSAGVYLFKIQAGEFVDTKKMILLK